MKSYTCSALVKEAAIKRYSMDHFSPELKRELTELAGESIDVMLPEYMDNKLYYSDADLDKATNWAAKYPTRAKLYNAASVVRKAGLAGGLLGAAFVPIMTVTDPQKGVKPLAITLGSLGAGLAGAAVESAARPAEIDELKAKLDTAATRKAYEIKTQLLKNDQFKHDFLWNTAFGGLDKDVYNYENVMLDLLSKYKVPKKVDLGVEIPRY